ncbi:MAG: ATP-binding protein [Gammaproteobacteria bacterium]
MEQHADVRARQLEDAFQLFTQMSSQLEASYRVLENRVARLNEELAAARSERLRQLAEKERLAHRLERLLDLLPGGIVVVDGAGVISDCNPAAAELLGEPLLGVAWRDVVARALQPYSEDGGEVSLRDGRKLSISTRTLDPEPGRIILLMDVTEQHALQAMLNRHRRLSAMGEMAAGLAHQIRTPLATALLYVSHLGADGLADHERERFAGKAIGRLRHLERMVNDMLQFARDGSFDMEDVDLELLVHDLRQTLEPQLQAAAGQLSFVNSAPGARLRGNPEALLSALLNLAGNAMDARSEGLRLQLDASYTGERDVLLRLSDNGPGIPADIRERLFTPFFTTRPNGTGLGLAVVRAIVLAHEGDVWLQSSSSSGSVFTLRIPTADRHGVLPSGSDATSADAGRLPATTRVQNCA